MLIAYLWAYAAFALATLVCASACLWGGTNERVVAATFWIAWVLTFLVANHGSRGPGDLVIVIDSLVLVVFVAMSFKARHVWLLLATASQFDDVASHLSARVLHLGRFSYLVATGIWGGYFITACLAAGTIGYRLRRKREAARLTQEAA